MLFSSAFLRETIAVQLAILVRLEKILAVGRGLYFDDVDFIIKMDEQAWRCLKLIEAINLDDEDEASKDYDLSERKKMIILNVDGLILNIWKYDEESDWSCIKDSETGVYVATVNHIIEAKKKYARDKDFKDIYEIIKGLV